MNIIRDKITVKPFKNGLKPGLMFSVPYNFKKGKTIVTRLKGELWMGNKMITSLRENHQNTTYWTVKPFGKKTEEKLTANFYCILGREELSFIEEERQRNVKKNVLFKLKIRYDLLETGIGQGSFSNTQLIANLSYLMSNIYEFRQDSVDIPHTITSSDWLHDLSPHLNIGEFVVFELPIPTLSDNSDFISGYLHKCVDAIKDMKKHYLRGEWTDMILASRPIWEAPKNEKVDQIKTLLEGSGYKDELLENYQTLFNALFDIGSKHTHILARYQGKNKTRTLLPEAPSFREDAVLMYSLSVNFTNLMARKFERMNLK